MVAIPGSLAFVAYKTDVSFGEGLLPPKLTLRNMKQQIR